MVKAMEKKPEEYLKSKLDHIGMHLHSLSVYVSNNNSDNFIQTFESFKTAIEEHFKMEEEKFLKESNKINYYHKVVHRIFLLDLIRYESSIHDSNEARTKILVKIQNWYLNHLKDFDSLLVKG